MPACLPRWKPCRIATICWLIATLNAHLAGRDFIAAGQFSIADLTAVVAVDFARVVKVKPGDEHPHLRRWREAMQTRGTMG